MLAGADALAKEVTGPSGGQRRFAFDRLKGETLGPSRSVPASIKGAAVSMSDAMAGVAMEIADQYPNWGDMTREHTRDWTNAVRTIYGTGAGGVFKMNDGGMRPLSDATATDLFNKPNFTGEGRIYSLDRSTGEIVQNHIINVRQQ